MVWVGLADLLFEFLPPAAVARVVLALGPQLSIGALLDCRFAVPTVPATAYVPEVEPVVARNGVPANTNWAR